ncbi:MAG: hypothetical protein PWQ30_1809 [Euryarchaeota archaeon]|jgi:hypothetical protein|nr:hypothetical protein [Euryarchaeota archaeon]
MKTRAQSRIVILTVALLVAGAIFVPAVSATGSSETHPHGGDPVDRDVVLGRSPHLFDDTGNRLSDREISQMIERMPKVTYLDGMNESRSRELSEDLARLHQYRSVIVSGSQDASPQPTSVQADSGIRINEHHQGPAASAGKLQSYQPALTRLDVEHLKAGLNRQEPVTITLGGLPSSKGGKGIPLSSFTTATESLIWERYLYPNGSLIGFGYDHDGYLRVSIWNGPPPPENTSSIEAVYAMLDGRAREMGIEDIPVKFTVFTSPPELVFGPRMHSPWWMRLCGAP